MKKKFALAAVIICWLGWTLPLTFITGCASHPSSAGYVNDQTISAKVKSDLLRDPVVNAMDVNVTTYEGTVELTGYVGNPEAKKRAGQIAARAPGVKTVRNDLIIQTGR